ncbi:phage tail spike protein [Virgibacillus halophilus]|uniref:Phage tail spike protein n=1 Tax=Tigheibacillus halophilus TaxID=361280 RepID=A0ABU5C641_9BACI|nr:phage tail spike protein [Virgibacillus halophilus]
MNKKIIYCKRQGKGDLMTAEIKAIPLFFDVLDNDRIYERIDKHMTAMEAFTKIFADTGFTFVLSDQFDAVEWEGFGDGESKLETFKRAIERYKCEFRISGKIVYLENQIGRDTQFMYRYRLNASNIVQEIDANEMWTYARGYGDYGDGEGGEDWQSAKLFREYTSPLAKIPTIGIRHAPRITDGNIKDKDTMDTRLKALVDESLKISLTADLQDLQEQGYPIAQSELGDRVFLIDERIGLDEEIRVVAHSKTRDWRGKVIDLTNTFGSEGLTKRHQSQMNTAAKQINDLIAGRKKLPFSVLPEAKQNAIKALESAQTELIFGDAGNGVQGIIAQDKNDPNKLVWLNSAGWMISTDGGATATVAATADGIVADVITAGILNADQVAIRGGSGKNYVYISGDLLEQSGTYTRTWKGQTSTNEASIKLENGYIRLRDEKRGLSRYIMPNGDSTFMDGEGEYLDQPGSSGTIEWWDTTYSPSGAHGITMSSYGGAVALRSDLSHVVLDSYQSVDIYSKNSVVYITPKSNESGNSNFWFNRIDGTNDGFLMFGSRETQPGVGLRFSKSGATLSVVDKDYNRGGDTTFDVGSIKVNNITKRNSNTAPYWNNTSGGSTSIEVNPDVFRASGIRAITGSKDIFFATNEGGWVRATNELGNNQGGEITYRGFVGSEFRKIENGASAAGTFSLMSLRPQVDEASKIIYDLDISRRTENGNPAFYLMQESPIHSGEGTDISKAVMYLLKSQQEVLSRVDKLEGVS